MKTLKRILPALFAALALMAPPVAQAAREMKVTNHGWEITWSDQRATARHVESGKEIQLYKDRKSEAEGNRLENNYTMLSVVGTVVSYRFEWYSEGGAHPSYGTAYEATDLSKFNSKIRTGKERLPKANLAELFGSKAVFRALVTEPTVLAGVRGDLGDTGRPPGSGATANPNPKSLKDVTEAADGGCQAKMGENLLTDFYFAFLLGGKVAAVQIGLSHGCEAMRGEFTRLDRIYLPVPEAMAEDFERAVKDGALEARPFTEPSFDCNKAGSAIEFAICADAKLATLDVQLGDAYQAARKAVAGDAKEELKRGQRAWIRQRNKDCAGGNIDCLKRAYEARIAELG